MNNSAEVFLWGSRVGVLHQEENVSFASFEYDKEFISSGVEPSPITMPVSNRVYSFPTLAETSFYGLPGLVADSLPDNFGNKVIEQWLAAKGKSIKDFSAIDRLCYTGQRGIGALEYVPTIYDIENIDENINVSEMVQFASDVLNNRAEVKLNAENELTYAQLVQVGSSAGGARAKALIAWNEKTNDIRSGQLNLGEDYDYWLMKFDNVSGNGDHGEPDAPQYTLIEYAYYKMAIDAGIKMNECRIYSNESGNHFMTKRFDRVNGQKLHMQSLGALTHISYNQPGLCSYEMAAQYMQRLNLSIEEIEELFRRMVFNCIAVNQDDHVKNISFLMNKKGEWSLAPAYDLTFSYSPSNKWLCAHQMTVNNKMSNITEKDILEAGINMGLRKKKCKDIIEKISNVVSNFEMYADEVKIKEQTYQAIKKVQASSVIEV